MTKVEKITVPYSVNRWSMCGLDLSQFAEYCLIPGHDYKAFNSFSRSGFGADWTLTWVWHQCWKMSWFLWNQSFLRILPGIHNFKNSTALYAACTVDLVDTVDMVYTLDMVYNVYTVSTIEACSMYGILFWKVTTLLKAADELMSKKWEWSGWMGDTP